MNPHTNTIQILEKLIGYPTISASSNLELIDYTEDHLTKAGFQTNRSPDLTGTKSGLMARIGPDGPGGILLSAHSDVVPTEGQKWLRPSFELTREEDRLYGRGTTDMKGFLASMLAAAGQAGGLSLSAPLMLAISYDEEIGCVGIRNMLPVIKKLGWTPELCLVGEPTRMQPVIGHKGKAAMRAVCRGNAGHSSLAPFYVNALHLAAEFIMALRKIQKDYANAARQDANYDVPYSTVHAGKLQGGTALNIVPDAAQVDFELRYLPFDQLEEFQNRLQQEISRILKPYRQQSEAANIELTLVNTYPGLEVDPEDFAVGLATQMSGYNSMEKVGFGTEAGYFTQLGFPTIVCGPGDMEGQGHKPDEYITLDQLNQCDLMMKRVLAHLQ